MGVDSSDYAKQLGLVQSKALVFKEVGQVILVNETLVVFVDGAEGIVNCEVGLLLQVLHLQAYSSV